MTQHTIIGNGGGHYCSRCLCAWDQGETPPAVCRADPADSSFLNGGPATDDGYTFSAEEIRPGHQLIAFAGEKGAGKDTAATVLIAEGWTNVKMADGLKVMLRALLAFRGCPAPEIERMLEGDLKETPSRYLSGRTPRHAMQTLGTDWARTLMSPDFWVETTEDRLDRLPCAVITDIRFHNEAALVERRGGRLYLIERPSKGGVDTHVSETELRTIRADGVILNDFGTASDLQEETRRRLAADGLLT